MLNRSGHQGVPQILIGDDIVVGFNRPQIENLLRRYAPDAASQGVSLGVRVADATAHAPSGAPGAYVGYVKPNSLADRAGIASGDIIVALDGQAIRSANDLIVFGKRLTPGRSVSATILRDNGARTVTIKT